ncbi:DUF11 domain-containing protein [Tautonia sociabilis]|uniref:DUF11 domain-containing protein n=1 Tax=Tautonia sociabilis TaxID=2080755 RepID=A0A432MP79_9BACT|nr:DUF11 domain-containing protein [Tautonia sociabilis]RUL89241.1 DUF11 domain-containing protein [Tautonia sociabilis]
MTPARRTGPAATAALLLAVALGSMAHRAEARQFPDGDPVGVAELNAAPPPAAPASPAPGPMLPPNIQVVRFTGPPGLVIEVLEPAPIGVPIPEDQRDAGGLTVGLQVGVGYRLRISNLPNRPDAEFFPVVEVVGHLHRPPDIDPVRFPIRVVFGLEDLVDVADSGRLVTQVIYLEPQDQALPISLPPEMIPTTTIGPGEDPLRVAGALGRVMAIVRLGGRTPDFGQPVGLGLGLVAGPCPFEHAEGGGRCGMPICPPLVPADPTKPLFPGDEYLCDGGDHASKAGVGPDGNLLGVEPQDAMIRFNAGSKPRVLPTNTVCLYAPRFAAIRNSLGTNENTVITVPRGAEALSQPMIKAESRPPIRITQTLAADALRARRRASAIESRTPPVTHIEIRVLNEFSEVVLIDEADLVQGPQEQNGIVRAITSQKDVAAVGIKTAEGPVVTGIVQGAGETVMSWKPGEIAGVEPPPDQPGLAVVKEVDTAVAEPGQVLTYTIRWRNMGNVPISHVSIVDSLLPRLEYVPNSARGPAGSVFTATQGGLAVERGQAEDGTTFSASENAAGSTELRWDLPAPLLPGQEGAVSFQARVR